jgi:hypothetical protein
MLLGSRHCARTAGAVLDSQSPDLSIEIPAIAQLGVGKLLAWHGVLRI